MLSQDRIRAMFIPAIGYALLEVKLVHPIYKEDRIFYYYIIIIILYIIIYYCYIIILRWQEAHMEGFATIL